MAVVLQSIWYYIDVYSWKGCHCLAHPIHTRTLYRGSDFN